MFSKSAHVENRVLPSIVLVYKNGSELTPFASCSTHTVRRENFLSHKREEEWFLRLDRLFVIEVLTMYDALDQEDRDVLRSTLANPHARY